MRATNLFVKRYLYQTLAQINKLAQSYLGRDNKLRAAIIKFVSLHLHHGFDK